MEYAESAPCLKAASPEAAVGSPRPQLDLQQPPASPMLSTSEELDMSHIWIMVEAGLIKCRLMFDRLPQPAINQVQKQLPLTQLVALSSMCAKVKFGKGLSHYVQTLCQPGDLPELVLWQAD